MSTCEVFLFYCYLTCGFSLGNILIYGEGETGQNIGQNVTIINKQHMNTLSASTPSALVDYFRG